MLSPKYCQIYTFFLLENFDKDNVHETKKGQKLHEKFKKTPGLAELERNKELN